MPTHMVIHNGVISLYVAPGGAVSDEVDKVARNAYRIAKFEAASIARTGTLERGIFWAKAKPQSPDRTEARVSSTAKHAMWVEEGTGTIVPNKGKYLTVPKSAGSVSGGTLRSTWLAGGKDGPKPFFLARSISGQSGQHIMRDSLHRAMGMYR